MRILECTLDVDVKYWSNSCGDLHQNGRCDITEEELPKELLRVYRELWTDDTSSLCYLTEFEGNYYVSLENEFPHEYINHIGISPKNLCEYMEKKAGNYAEMEAFNKAVILLVQDDIVGYDFVTLLPWDSDKATFTIVSMILLADFGQEAMDALHKTEKEKSAAVAVQRLIDKYRRQAGRNKVREKEMKAKKKELSNHGYWSMGCYGTKADVYDDFADELSEILELLKG